MAVGVARQRRRSAPQVLANIETMKQPEHTLETADIAVLLPCYNEAGAIGGVIDNFRKVLPHARIFVYDNNSTDDTIKEARDHGAHVFTETRQGKGYVVVRMFADIDADVYVMADGDGTYDASAAPKMIAHLLENRLDMVTGTRKQKAENAYRRGHVWGNRMFNIAASRIFGTTIGDILSGYRVFSRRYVKSFPALPRGFEIETELSVHAVQLHLPTDEMETDYFDRSGGTVSKLSTYKDGFRIMRRILSLFSHVRPLMYYGLIGLVSLLVAGLLSLPVLIDYLQTGLVPRFPSLIVSMGLVVIAVIAYVCGLILDQVAHSRRDAKRLAYLAAGRLSDSPRS